MDDWEEMLRETARRSGVSPQYAGEILDAFFDAAAGGMQRDELVMLRPDVGHFEMRGAAGVRTPVFRRSGLLKTRLNRGR